MPGAIEGWWRRRNIGRSAAAVARWVVVDCETSGLDAKTDRLLSIGAVALSNARIVVDDSFSAVLRGAQPSGRENILIHGISGTAQMQGMDPAEVMGDFIEYASHDPLVAYHADFDRAMLDRVARSHGEALSAAGWLDLAELLPILFDAKGRTCRTLDDWLDAFSIRSLARHDALGDAYATAQLFQVALAEMPRHGLASVRDVLRVGSHRKWLGSAAR